MRTLSRWLLLLGLIGCGLYFKPAITKSGIYFKPAQSKSGLYFKPAEYLMATTSRTQKTPRTPAAPTTKKLSPESDRWVGQTLKKMTLDEKIGQLFAVWCYGGFLSTESLEYKDLLRDVEEKHIGSFAIQTQGSPLGIERSQVYPTAVLVNTLQSHAKVPLLIAADFERGTSMRIDEGASFPHSMAVAATGRPEDAYTVGKITALEAKAPPIPSSTLAPLAKIPHASPNSLPRSCAESKKTAASPPQNIFPATVTPAPIRISICRQ